MATKNFRSTVLEPTSEFAHGDKLRFTALSSINQVFKRSFSEVTIGVDGVYDIDLQYGKHRIDYKPYEGVWALFANVEVGAETTATTLQDLAMTSSPVTDDTILALQAILDETKANAENAEKSSVDSMASAAEAAKDRYEIEGLMLRAMTTADVNAIRESNKNLFAASGVAEWGNRDSTPVNTLKNGLNCTTTANTLLHDGKYHVAGLLFDIPDNSPINFDAAPDGKTTYHKTTGAVTKYGTVQEAFAAANADANIEVVTDRTDVYALEVYLRDITEEDPMIYPHGYIHAQDAGINGVATSLDAVRPDSYYAHYVGQADVIRGKSINWFTATNAEKLTILSVSDKHGYIHHDPATGNWRQWCVRIITLNGDGNGDWLVVSPQSKILGFNEVTVRGRVTAQGITDTRHSGYVAGGDSFYAGTYSSYNRYPARGVFTAFSDINVAVNNECYILVLGTVSRLSHSVWHPSHNPTGCYKYTSANLNPLGQGIASKERCFIPENIGTQSARPDSRVHNLIYGSGYGGVCRDMRYGAYHTTKEAINATTLSVCNGDYRGFEKRVRSEIYEIGTGNHPNVSELFNLTNWGYPAVFLETIGKPFNTGDCVTIFKKNSNVYMRGSIFSIEWSSSTPCIYLNNHDFVNNGFPDVGTGVTDLVVVITHKLNQSIGGEYCHHEVNLGIANDITTQPDFSNGWEGSLVTKQMDGTVKTFEYTRLNKYGYHLTAQTSNNVVWTNFTQWSIGVNLPHNAYIGIGGLSGDIEYWGYYINANTTKASLNTAIHSCSNTVIASSDCYRYGYAYAASSLLGLHLKSQDNYRTQQACLSNTLVSSESGELSGYMAVVPISHSPLELSLQTTGSVAFKVLTYSTGTYSQCSLNFAATGLVYGEKDGVQSWGDDSQIHIVDNESTMIDLNGNTVKTVTHTLAEPIGWVK